MTELAGLEPAHYCRTRYCTEALGHAGDCSGAGLRAAVREARIASNQTPAYMNMWLEDHPCGDPPQMVRYLVVGVVPTAGPPAGLIVMRTPLSFLAELPELQDMLSLMDPALIRRLYPDAKR